MTKRVRESAGSVQFSVSIGSIIKHLGRGLYRNHAECLAEIFRNACVACMKGDQWNPSDVRVELNLVKNHPLAPGVTSLMILDYGSGFTKPNLERFLSIGLKDDEEDGASHGGASQKRIGKLAAFALNKRRGQHGKGLFYILSRTSSKGPIILYEISPKTMATRVELQRIEPDSSELGEGYKNLKGSFSLIIIPDCVYASLDEVREDLRWRLPRKKDRALNVKVGGQGLESPPLASKTRKLECIEMYIEKVPSLQDTQQGIWLTDAATGLRCAEATKLGHGVLPYPLHRSDLRGDIFLDNLLAHQSTDRSGLSQEYLESKEWAAHYQNLSQVAAKFAKDVLGDEDKFDDTGSGAIVQSIIEDLQRIGGVPERSGPGFGSGPRPKPPNPDTGSGGGSGGGRPPGGDPPKPKPPSGVGDEVTRNVKGFIIDGREFFIAAKIWPEDVFAKMEGSREMIYVNTKHYRGAPKGKLEWREHLFAAIIRAIADSNFPSDSDQASKEYGRLRIAIEEGRNKKT